MLRSPLHFDLSPEERSTLESWLRCATTPNGWAQRVRVVLRFADGRTIRQIACDMGMARNTVKLWLRRFGSKRLEGFDQRPQLLILGA